MGVMTISTMMMLTSVIQSVEPTSAAGTGVGVAVCAPTIAEPREGLPSIALAAARSTPTPNMPTGRRVRRSLCLST